MKRSRVCPILKLCPRCKLTKHTTDFHDEPARPDGLRVWCRHCAITLCRQIRARKQKAKVYKRIPRPVIDGKKECGRCRQPREIGLFHARQTICKPCLREDAAIAWQEKLERRRAERDEMTRRMLRGEATREDCLSARL